MYARTDNDRTSANRDVRLSTFRSAEKHTIPNKRARMKNKYYAVTRNPEKQELGRSVEIRKESSCRATIKNFSMDN